MKHRVWIALILVMLLTASACSPQKAEQTLDAVEDAVEQRVDAVEAAVDRRLDGIEDAVEDKITITPAPVPKADVPVTQPAPAQPDKPIPDAPPAKPTRTAEEYLSGEQAQTIALEHANLTAGEVTHLRVEFDMDDGVPEYDVEFRHGRLEYEYEIHAVTGAIRSHDVDD